MRAKYFLLIIVFFGSVCNAQDKIPYRIFDKKGKKTSYEKLLKASAKTDVVLFGEHHNNSIVHWLQLEFTKDLSLRKDLVLGAEMLEADNQQQLNRYLKGEIEQETLDSVARLWPNYGTDYKPLVDFAKSKKIPFIATNIPRRFASMVFKKGFEALESLSDEEKTWMAPLPIRYDANLPGYVKMMKEMEGHGGANLPKAQAVKDATMAYWIAKNRKENTVFIHYNGTYHSDNYDGIYWYLKKESPSLKIISIATVSQNNISKLETEHYNKADFILVVDEDVTKTR
ncbi:ChaN family lipoprotein [Flavobacterium sp. GT3R68]|uniref:ChaN family lipoprotein n=1 Tax=Flavobacterium sp. GT3R68 TaxID=2594437 RepID=UPI000F88A3F2|nr:ChaN family lipoprotein [Flavobacterium sp. GT3R68]RTY96051.1 iron-regulated protein [Flavobacterium sp. GSN2]TRW94169.1 ChaN family lipoprotein [Flavobacterium sp. GT3R68]